MKITRNGSTAFGEYSINNGRSIWRETDEAEGRVLETNPHTEHISACIWTGAKQHLGN